MAQLKDIQKFPVSYQGRTLIIGNLKQMHIVLHITFEKGTTMVCGGGAEATLDSGKRIDEWLSSAIYPALQDMYQHIQISDQQDAEVQQLKDGIANLKIEQLRVIREAQFSIYCRTEPLFFLRVRMNSSLKKKADRLWCSIIINQLSEEDVRVFLGDK